MIKVEFKALEVEDEDRGELRNARALESVDASVTLLAEVLIFTLEHLPLDEEVQALLDGALVVDGERERVEKLAPLTLERRLGPTVRFVTHLYLLLAYDLVHYLAAEASLEQLLMLGPLDGLGSEFGVWGLGFGASPKGISKASSSCSWSTRKPGFSVRSGTQNSLFVASSLDLRVPYFRVW